MKNKILVAYETKYGSTKEVAVDMAETLRAGGIDVDVCKVDQIASLEDYRLVILGVPLYIGSWLKGGHRFLKRHRHFLETRPLAIFSLGPLHETEKEHREGISQIEKELAKYPWLKPISYESFTGKFTPDLLRFPDSLLTKLKGTPLYQMPSLDERNWAAIRAWAQHLASQVKQPAE